MARRELLALLEACKREPEEDAARLVLADWLEGHGDEADRRRGEFVRLHVTSGEAKGRLDFMWLRMRQWHDHRAQWAPFQAALRKSLDPDKLADELPADRPLGRHPHGGRCTAFARVRAAGRRAFGGRPTAAGGVVGFRGAEPPRRPGPASGPGRRR
jgi:uncharacterized protein (TIGR02996 family)